MFSVLWLLTILIVVSQNFEWFVSFYIFEYLSTLFGNNFSAVFQFPAGPITHLHTVSVS